MNTALEILASIFLLAISCLLAWIVGLHQGRQSVIERFAVPHTPALSDDGNGNVICYGRVLERGHDETDGSVNATGGIENGD